VARSDPFSSRRVGYPRLVAVTPPTTASSGDLSLARDALGPHGAGVTGRICPYLLSDDGAWRSAVASRDQHCGAVNPPSPLALDKQRRLCLAEYTACATYVAAAPAAPPRADGRTGAVTRWLLVRTAPVVLDQGRVASVTQLARRRTAPQLALGGLMALALATVVLARLPGSDASLAGAVGSPSAGESLLASRAPARTSSAGTVASASPSAAAPSASATARPASSPGPSSGARTYRVVAGDTLYAIALRFNTTVAGIVAENDLSSTGLRIGQVLEIP
jgi:LysM repeat protein